MSMVLLYFLLQKAKTQKLQSKLKARLGIQANFEYLIDHISKKKKKEKHLKKSCDIKPTLPRVITLTHTCAWTHRDTGTNMHKHHTQIHEKNEPKNQTYSYYHRACVIYFLKYISITAKKIMFLLSLVTCGLVLLTKII